MFQQKQTYNQEIAGSTPAVVKTFLHPFEINSSDDHGLRIAMKSFFPYFLFISFFLTLILASGSSGFRERHLN
jgi:hypothetical protein